MLTPVSPRLDRPAPAAPGTAVPGTATPADAAAGLRAEVAARLAPVCAGMAPEHVERLVADVTAFTLRWSGDAAVRSAGVTFRAD